MELTNDTSPAFGVDQLADGTPIGLWFTPGIIENDEYDRAFIGLDGLRELRTQLDAALAGWEDEPQPEPGRDLQWFMYSPEGDQAVAEAVEEILKEAEGGAFDSKESMAVRARVLVKGVAVDHPEVYDTEPRCAIGDALDEVCEANGWTYSSWEGYDL